MRALALAVSFGVLAAGGCASTTYTHQSGDNRVSGAFEQPFRDVSVMRENPPDILMHAAQSPYALPGDGGCSAILEEIASLDLVLGPDVDAPGRPAPRSNTDVSAFVSGAIGGVIGLPFRSIVRRLSGAENRARVVREAIFAGMVRRAFLKGVARADNCTTAPAPANAAVSGGETQSATNLPQPSATVQQEGAPQTSVPVTSAPAPSVSEQNTPTPEQAMPSQSGADH